MDKNQTENASGTSTLDLSDNLPRSSEIPLPGGASVVGKWGSNGETKVALQGEGGMQDVVDVALAAAARLRAQMGSNAKIEIDGNEVVIRFRGTDQEQRRKATDVI